MRLFLNQNIRTFILGIVLASVTTAQDQVLSGGELAGYKIWRGTLIIQGDVTIPSGSQLNVEPGTKIYFAANRDDQRGGNDKTRSELIIRGKLIVRGSAENKIVFTSQSGSPRMGDWYGLQFLHSQPGCVMEYAVIEYAYNGIAIKNTGFPVSNCEIRYNYNSGIRTEVKASPQISQNIITENGYAGMVCELGAMPVLTDNLISQNPMGVVILSLSKPNLGSLGKDENFNPGRNQFSNNEEYDLYNHSSKPIMAQNNSWDSDRRPKLFDQQDNGKYGSINFNPKLNQRSSGNLLLLAQNTSTAPSQPARANQVNNQNRQNLTLDRNIGENNNNAGNNKAGDSGLDTLFQNTPAIHTESSAEPLMASTSGFTPENGDTPIDIDQIRHVIDYNKIFLEPFLDTHKKKIIRKENLYMNETIRRILEPGEVRIKVTVDTDGTVLAAGVLRGINPILDDTILQVVKKYLYEPGTVNGKPVRFSTNEVFRFK